MLGKRARWAFDQSRYSVESCVRQNRRSAASFENLGNGLRFVIGRSFLSGHVSAGDHPYFPAADGESHKQSPPIIRVTQSEKPGFPVAVILVREQQQGLVEKDLLGFGRRNAMFRPTLDDVAGIPFKALDVLYRDHHCILSKYTARRNGFGV